MADGEEQGDTVETEACGGAAQLDLRGDWGPGDWECRHGEGLAADRPEVTAEVGAKCRCGCSVELQPEDRPRILAASSHKCPGRSFWLVQVWPTISYFPSPAGGALVWVILCQHRSVL